MPPGAEHFCQRLARRAFVIHGQNSCAAQDEDLPTAFAWCVTEKRN
ncbi:hypothetical protein DB31_5684 [Hyalangium minutum]|uniref:Uncharacterized protein n=1 Tax=Hyalangium minutum TaxID=394096 RepID=A0A085WSH9_9BACT|nr:hypothetical protein DB31_5684 [Hyalangium minutum]